MAPKLCSVVGCNRPHEARGWCKPHYRRVITTGRLRPEEPISGGRAIPGPCGRHGCLNRARAGGLCKAHYVAQRPVAERKAGKARQRARLNAELVVLKAHPCVDCGLQWPSWAMDFHHRDPALKKHGVGEGRTRKSMLAEAAKCDLLCAICHRARHYCDTMTSAVTV